MTPLILTFPVATRERIQVRLLEAEAHNLKRPTKMTLSRRDYDLLRKNMVKHGYGPHKPLDVLNIPIVYGDTEPRTILFSWE